MIRTCDPLVRSQQNRYFRRFLKSSKLCSDRYFWFFTVDKVFTPFQTISIHNKKFGVNLGVTIMDVKAKVFRRKTGKSKNTWIVRIQYFDEIKGKTSFMERHAEKMADANDLRDKLVDDIKKTHGQIQTGERMTFSQLADICEMTFYKPAVIIEGRKVAGIR